MSNSHLFTYSNHLGAFNPFFIENDSGFTFDPAFSGIVDEVDEPLELDVTAIASVLSKHYIMGDRTLIKGIHRSPWMARPDYESRTWNFHELPPHGDKNMSIGKISERMFHLLSEEIKEYTKECKQVGILLSGGMDSRMVAGVLDSLIKRGETVIERVVVYTWGNNNSRDVVYSKKIADRMGWEWKHFVIEGKKFLRNLEIAGQRGCEYTGIHLHAMPDIADVADVDVIIAGSYGDSVGRAEYSGQHVTNLQPMEKGVRNFAFLIDRNEYRNIKGEWEMDIEKYHSRFPREHTYQVNEVERQLHFMRRMLNPCMEVINEKVPVRQAFTAPSVFGFMWSFSPEFRNDDLYKELPRFFETKLDDIPWARTGLRYGTKTGIPDEFEKNHYSYPDYIQNDLMDVIEKKIIQTTLPVIDKSQTLKLIQLIRKRPNHNFDYLEAISWVYSFCIFLDTYKVEFDYSSKSSSRLDSWMLTGEYFLKRNYRRIKYGV